MTESAPSTHARLENLRARRKYSTPDDALGKLGFNVAQPGEHLDLAATRDLLKQLFGREFTQLTSERFGRLRREVVTPQALVAELQTEAGFPALSEEEGTSLCHWFERIADNRTDNINARTFALKYGCHLKSGTDPILRHLEERGITRNFLVQFTHRLYSAFELLTQRQHQSVPRSAAELPDLYRQRTEARIAAADRSVLRRLAVAIRSHEETIDRAVREFIRTPQPGFSEPGISAAATHDEQIELLKGVLLSCADLLSREANRLSKEDIHELVFSIVQNLKAEQEQLQDLIEYSGTEDYHPDTSRSLRTLPPIVGSGTDRDGLMRFILPAVTFCNPGDLTGRVKERETLQNGSPFINAKLLILPVDGGEHVSIQLPTWLTQRIIHEARRLRYFPGIAGAPGTSGAQYIQQIYNRINTQWHGTDTRPSLPDRIAAAERQLPLVQELRELADLTTEESELPSLQSDLDALLHDENLPEWAEADLTTVQAFQAHMKKRVDVAETKINTLRRKARRLDQYSRLLFQRPPSELPDLDLAAHINDPEIRRRYSLHKSQAVYLRMLGFHLASIIHKVAPELLRMNGAFAGDPDALIAAAEVSVRFETLRKGYTRSVINFRTPGPETHSPGRLGSLMQKTADPPKIMLFSDKTAFFAGMNPNDVLAMLSSRPVIPPTPVPPPPVDPPDDGPQEDPPSAPPVEDPPPPVPPEEHDTPLEKPEREAITDYRVFYGRYVLEEFSRIRTMASCMATGATEFPYKRICIAETRDNIKHGDPYDDSVEWFNQSSYQKPEWEARDPSRMHAEDSFDKILTTFESDDDLGSLQQAYDHLEEGGTMEITFPMDPPTKEFRRALGELGEVSVVKPAGRAISSDAFDIIQDAGCTGEFARKFKKYLQRSIQGITVLEIKKTKAGRLPDGLRNVLNPDQRFVHEEERKMVDDLGQVFDFLRSAESHRQVRRHVAHKLLTNSMASELVDLDKGIYESLMNTAIHVALESSNSKDINAINDLLTSICTMGRGASAVDRGRMSNHPAFACSLYAFNTYISKAEPPTPHVLMAVHEDPPTREAYLVWLRAQPLEYRLEVERKLMERVEDEEARDVAGRFRSDLRIIVGPSAPPPPPEDPAVAIARWRARRESLTVPAITDEIKRRWLDEGLKMEVLSEQEFALQAIPALQFQDPVVYITCINQNQSIIVDDILPEVANRVWYDNVTQPNGQPLSKRVSKDLIVRLLTISTEAWDAIPVESLTPSQLELWARIGLGLEIDGRSIRASDATRTKAILTMSESNPSAPSLAAHMLNQDGILSEELVATATKLILSDATGKAFDELNNTGLDIITYSGGVEAHRNALIDAVISASERQTIISPAKAALLDACAPGGNAAAARIVHLTEAYMLKFNQDFVNGLERGKVRQKLDEFAYPVLSAEFVKKAQENGVAGFISSTCVSLLGEDTLMGYLYQKASGHSDSAIERLRYALADEQQRTWVKEMMEILRDPLGIDPPLKINVDGVVEEDDQVSSSSSSEGSERSITQSISIEDIEPDTVDLLCQDADEGNGDEVLVKSASGETLRICSPHQLREDMKSLSALKQQDLPQKWRNWGAEATLGSDEKFYKNPDNFKITVRPINEESRKIQLSTEEATTLNPETLSSDDEHKTIVFVPVPPAHYAITLKSEDVLFSPDALVPPMESKLFDIYPIKFSYEGTEVTDPAQLEATRDKKRKKIKEELWQAHPLKAIHDQLTSTNCMLTIDHSEETISSKKYRRLTERERVGRTIFKRGDMLSVTNIGGRPLYQSQDLDAIRAVTADLTTHFAESVRETGEPQASWGSVKKAVKYDEEKNQWVLEVTNQECFDGMRQEALLLPQREGAKKTDNSLIIVKVPMSSIKLYPYDEGYKDAIRSLFEMSGFMVEDVPYFGEASSNSNAAQRQDDSAPAEAPSWMDRLFGRS